jgi:hypothetical protein
MNPGYPLRHLELGAKSALKSSNLLAQGGMGEPGLVGEGNEPEAGRPSTVRGRTEAPLGSPRAERGAGIGTHPKHERGRGLETLPRQGVVASGALQIRTPLFSS